MEKSEVYLIVTALAVAVAVGLLTAGALVFGPNGNAIVTLVAEEVTIDTVYHSRVDMNGRFIFHKPDFEPMTEFTFKNVGEPGRFKFEITDLQGKKIYSTYTVTINRESKVKVSGLIHYSSIRRVYSWQNGEWIVTYENAKVDSKVE